MVKQNVWIGVGLIVVILAVALILTGQVQVPFAAIPISDQQHWLPDLPIGTAKTLQITFNNGDKAFQQLQYKVVIYGPNANQEGADEHLVTDWTIKGAVAANSQTTFSVAVPPAVYNTAGDYYAVLVYVRDDADLTGCSDPNDYSSCIYRGIVRSAFDTQYVTACKANPTQYGCTTGNKNVCCSGSGYWMNVVSGEPTEYSGILTVS